MYIADFVLISSWLNDLTQSLKINPQVIMSKIGDFEQTIIDRLEKSNVCCRCIHATTTILKNLNGDSKSFFATVYVMGYADCNLFHQRRIVWALCSLPEGDDRVYSGLDEKDFCKHFQLKGA